MSKDFVRFLDYCDREVVELISQKYGYDYMEAFHLFLNSETYNMLSNFELRMWEFSPNAIFDMWECEKITGEPRNSIYIKEA